MTEKVFKIHSKGRRIEANCIDLLEPELIHLTYNISGDTNFLVDAHGNRFVDNATKGFIFYQPGDMHDFDAISRTFQKLTIRIGDMHHLQNPLLKTIEFLRNLKINVSGIYLNTNPSLLNFLNLFFNQVDLVPLSELTIGLGLKARALEINRLNAEKLNKVVYCGPVKSPFHPRRTYVVSRLFYETGTRYIDHYPGADPFQWLKNLSKYTYSLAPSLNSQWSHNIFIPHLVNTGIITDVQNRPTYQYYGGLVNSYMKSFISSYSYRKLKEAIITHAGHPCMPKTLAEKAFSAFQTTDQTYRYIYEQKDSFVKVMPQIDHYPLILANVYEILQEVARVLVDHDFITVLFDDWKFYSFFSVYFPHARLVYSYSDTPDSVENQKVIVTSREFRVRTLTPKLLSICISEIFGTPKLTSRQFSCMQLSCFAATLEKMSKFCGVDYTPVLFSQNLLDAVTCYPC